MVPQTGKRSACPTTTNRDSAIVGQAHRLPFLDARATWLIAVLIAVLQAFMVISAANTKSPTFDEPQHLTAGYSYWVTNDFRLDPENGNLPMRWATLPLLFDDLKFAPLNDRGWQRAEEGRTAHQFFYEAGNDPDQMMRQARVMMSIFGAALCLLVFRIAREFFGLLGGLIAEIVAAFDPNFLAHSPLVDSDVPAAFFFTATVWCCWQLFQRITPGRLVIAALSLSGLFLTKFSAPIVLPILGAMSILRIFSRREIDLQFRESQIAVCETWKKACALGASWIVLGASVVFAIWLAFSFRYSAWIDNKPNDEGTTWHWNYLLEDPGTIKKTVNFARDHHLLPEAYLYGFAYVHKHEIDRPAFLDNQWSIVGFPSFFPRAFIYKTTLPLLGLLALGLVAAIIRRDRWKIDNFSALAPWATFVFIYGAFAIASQLNIGHRHLLPIYPALFVGCGAAAWLVRNQRSAIFAGAITILLLRQIGESFAVRPNYLAYFNQIAGGASRGYEHLVDSSLDWGQDLPALKSWIDNHRTVGEQKPVYLAYFGTADPRWYEIAVKMILPRNQFSRTPARLTRGIYCISATMLQSVYTADLGPWCTPYEQRYQSGLAQMNRDRESDVAQITNDRRLAPKLATDFEWLRLERLCAYLRHQRPAAQVGYSIFVFELNEAEIDQALFGPPVELKPKVSVGGY